MHPSKYLFLNYTSPVCCIEILVVSKLVTTSRCLSSGDGLIALPDY